MRNKSITIGARRLNLRASVSALLLYRQEFDGSLFDAIRQVAELKGDDAALTMLRVLWTLAANADNESVPDFIEFLRELNIGDEQTAQELFKVNQYALTALLDIPRRPIADEEGKKKGKKREPSACPDLQILAIAAGLGLGMNEWRHLRTADVIDLMIDAHGLSYEREGQADELEDVLGAFTVKGRTW
jgi:hypothetical protein